MVHGRFVAVALIAVALVVAGPAYAQTKLVKPAAGFPVKITKGGSYFLGSNLLVGVTHSDAIKVTVSNVSINLNGFSIIGPLAGSGIGVDAAGMTNVTVANGTVTGMGAAGISLGNNGVVQNVQVLANGAGGSGDGVDCGSGCLVSSCVVANNANGTGLTFTDATSGYLNNIISGNSATVASGTNMGGNVCNGSTCP